jgi:5-formyltetrahydrofolate cyclo-ligase
MVKSQLRKQYTLQRNALDPEQWELMNQEMLEQFSTIALDGIQFLMSYYPLPEQKEFDTTACEDLLRLQNDKLNIYWPRLSADETSMDAVLKIDNGSFSANKYNILEPVGSEIIEPQLLDAIFVPLLAFDLQGYRVGYGKGYYDRYLTKCAQDVVKIGFSFFEAVERIDNIHQFDVPLNFCITPKRVYEF